MEAKKSHSLPSANWRSRKADGNSAWVQRSENHGCPGITPSLRLQAWGLLMYVLESKGSSTRSVNAQEQEKMGVSVQEERRAIYPSFAFLFCLGPQWIGRWPVCIGEGRPSLVYQIKFQSLPETPSHMHPEMSYQIFGHHLAQLNWHIKLTITPYLGARERRMGREEKPH